MKKSRHKIKTARRFNMKFKKRGKYKQDEE